MAGEADEQVKVRAHYRSAFAGPSGQEVLRDLEAFTGDTHDLYSDNPLDMAYRLGARRVLLRIRAFLKESPS